tara:strand:- start:560 stop:1918 length:1359 start_codon:yes stop_codon:yes gene_type:complete
MSKQQLITYDYFMDTKNIFSLLRDYEWPVFLNSNYEKFPNERYDILTANPMHKVYAYENETIVESQDGNKNKVKTDALDVLSDIMKNFNSDYSNLPFTGGAIGYMSYDLGGVYEGSNKKSDLKIPLMSFGVYDWAIIVDHQLEKTILLYEKENEIIKRFKKLFSNDCFPSYQPESFNILSPCVSNMSHDEYKYKFKKIQNYIKDGDCYQINFSQRFCIQYKGDTWDIFNKVLPSYSAPYSAYMDFPFVKILCFSPERFLSYDGITVETKPIKGTRPVGDSEIQNEEAKNELTSSDKEKAENLMIVDLLRNDLGRNCEFGSVEVKKLFNIETFSNVHHLVSTIQGKIDKEKNIYNLIKGCFPGGSITGAPKIRAMQIIEELEPNSRSIYCGSIGYISSNGKADLNIAIRTVIAINDESLYFWGGGGIVFDSEENSEYKETFDKIKPLIDILKN